MDFLRQLGSINDLELCRIINRTLTGGYQRSERLRSEGPDQHVLFANKPLQQWHGRLHGFRILEPSPRKPDQQPLASVPKIKLQTRIDKWRSCAVSCPPDERVNKLCPSKLEDTPHGVGVLPA